MTTRLPSVFCALLILASTGSGARADTSPSIVRVWSSAALKDVVGRWRDGYRTQHPSVQIVATPTGSDVAMAGLYTGRADIALLGREPTTSEVQAFEWIFRFKPTPIEIMSGSVGTPEKSPALVVFVHRENPLSRLTLTQLDAIFGYEHLRGSKAITTWGDLGVRGDWATHPIALYGPDATSGTGLFFRHTVLNDSRKMNWDRMHEFSDETASDGSMRPAGAQIVDALAADRFGIGIAPLGLARPELKSLALAKNDGAPFVDANVQSVVSHTYPLARTVFAVVKRAPGQTVNPAVGEFLRYVLSNEGQADVAHDGAYLPLPGDVARAQLATVAAPASSPAPAKIYAQELVDETIARNPDLLGVTMLVTPPQRTESVIIASSAASADGSRHHVKLPLNDTSGSPVGALDLAFATSIGAQAAQQKAEQIRDALSRRILNAANLMDPYPLDPTVSTKTYAQRLVDQAMMTHPELLSLAMHVTLPQGNNIILGSSFGRIGKKADEDDMKVINTGKTMPGIYAGGKRFGAELALQDGPGKTIGALSVAYAYKEGDDQAKLINRAEALRDELRKQIASVEQLVQQEP